MGKASKWMMSFLLGKRDEKEKKKESSLSKENVTRTSTAIVPSTPTYKRRWSFGRSAKKEKSHKSSNSLDSITTTPIVTHVIVEMEKQQNDNIAVVVAKPQACQKVVSTTANAAVGISKAAADAAATMIQAAFRSYLARKALYALRGLVKLQALVRGHLVRKQMTSTLRRMHTLMAIQVRARFQRIQMADQESQLVAKSKSSNGFKRVHRIERTERGITTYYSGDLSLISKQEHQHEEICFTTPHNSPHNHTTMSKLTPGRASFTFEQSDYANSPFNDHLLQPNYMANTESSRAKLRSQSEPKQRPKSSRKPNTKRNASMDGRNVPLLDAQAQQYTPSHSKLIAQESQDPWFIKLYRSTRPVRDNESDTNYFNSVVAFEPHAALY